MHHRIATSRRDAFGRRDFCFSARILVRFVAGSLRDFCRREFCFPARILAKFAAGSRATCCAPATRLGLDTSRWKTLPEELTYQQLTCLCLRLLGAIINLTMVPRDVHAKNMEWIAWPHVVPVEEIVAQILPHQTLAKTMNKHQYPS